MVIEITVENLAIIEQTQIRLGPGFTVLTGETGAGKSLLVDAIELALGDRADSDLVRAGASRASVSVVFDLSDQPVLREKCHELGIPMEDNLLYIQREVFAEGRSQCRVSGKLTPVAGLKQLGQILVDMHGQHDHQSLLHPDRHLGFLDGWIGEPASSLAAQVAEKLETVEQLRRKLNAIRSGLRDREQKIDLLTYQVNEIEAASPQVGELETLENQLSRLKNAEKLALAATGALEALSTGETTSVDLLAASIRSLEDAAKLDDALNAVLEPLRNAFYSLEDGVRELREYESSVQSDPEILEETAARIDTLRKLRRKYGDDEAAVLLFLENAQSELALLTNVEENEADICEKLALAEAELVQTCQELTALRKEKATEFANLVEEQLHDLAMERALFEVRIEPKVPDITGADKVEFFFTANAGEPVRPLAKIASGGEISRVMLGIKTATAGKAGVPTLVFDEVDAGLGGRAAAVVALKLEQLAQHYQVLVISHLPQIASKASAHFRIEKTETAGRVRTSVRSLLLEERVDEIGRMISGAQLSESAKQAALELLGAH
ncbi:MAG TPA: DNA repair protein RecN [Fimbriimonadaceae bacterium]|jgi:DNA repair protein RecN (Recombination protein N)